MKYLKKLVKPFIYMIGIIVILPILIALMHYVGIINLKIVNIFKILISISSFLIGGFFIGKVSDEKGWLEGLKLSIIFLTVLTIFNYLGLDSGFNFKNLIYYVILIISSMLGSMIGINRKKDI